MRANRLENDVERIILKWVRAQKIERERSYAIVKKWKEANNNPKLFYDAKSCAKTYNDNERETEFVLHYPLFNIDWRIECKEQKAHNDGMVNRIVKDIEDVKYLEETMLILVLDGILLNQNIIRVILGWCKTFGVGSRVWLGSLVDFEAMLKKTVTLPKK